MEEIKKIPIAKTLEEHIQRENPLLLQALAGFRRLDRVARRLRLLDRNESLIRRVPWWPVISILGTFSAGKSTFVNRYLETELQATGNQAVDDRFTVICYSEDDKPQMLPGSALDADPRFPFYRISGDIDEVASGEGLRINTYLQLKTSASKNLRGKILLDSPGFDADSQRTATLRITDRIIDLSDLVLVFFDARHPEPGAMRDTLEHLVRETISRNDAAKFLFILNQMDATAREDNPEDIVAAWQRALASCGLTAGRFYRIYDEKSAAPFVDEALEKRFKAKKDEDLSEIYHRIQDVEVQRAYRIVELLQEAVRMIGGDEGVGQIKTLLSTWRRRTLILDGLAGLTFVLLLCGGYLLAPTNTFALLSAPVEGSMTGVVVLAVAVALGVGSHFIARGIAARRIGRDIPSASENRFGLDVRRAFKENTRWTRSALLVSLKGWGWLSRRSMKKLSSSHELMVQALNDNFTRPSG